MPCGCAVGCACKPRSPPLPFCAAPVVMDHARWCSTILIANSTGTEPSEIAWASCCCAVPTCWPLSTPPACGPTRMYAHTYIHTYIRAPSSCLDDRAETYRGHAPPFCISQLEVILGTYGVACIQREGTDAVKTIISNDMLFKHMVRGPPVHAWQKSVSCLSTPFFFPLFSPRTTSTSSRLGCQTTLVPPGSGKRRIHSQSHSTILPTHFFFLFPCMLAATRAGKCCRATSPSSTLRPTR